jgi:hypothetical protein
MGNFEQKKKLPIVLDSSWQMWRSNVDCVNETYSILYNILPVWLRLLYKN